MTFEIPRRVIVLIAIGLVLLTAAGAMNAVSDGLRANYDQECHSGYGLRPAPVFEPKENETQEPEPRTAEERQACRDARLPATIANAIERGALGPGIAIVAISAVYLLGAAIAMLRRG